ncbi:MAG: hypothetical protein ACI89L_002543 [Phycisphaerales bacterium]
MRTAYAVRMKTITLLLVASLLAVPSCKEKATSEPVATHNAGTPATEVAPDWVYTGVRGRVEKLPDAFGDLMIHHEHIPDFVAPMSGELNINKNGATGMRAMTMPFEPAAGVDVSTLKVGDMIEFDLAVWGKDSERGLGFNLTRFGMLPEGTELDFADKPSVEIPGDPADDSGDETGATGSDDGP